MYTENTKGYSLVEVLVAVAILLLALIGPMTIAAKSLQSSYYAREQVTALFLAQEGIELVVAMRNDSLISAVKGDLDDGWDWTDDVDNDCFSSSGCNIALNNSSNTNVLNQVDIEDCSNPERCVLNYDAGNGRARYTLSNGEPTKYTRVITLENISGGDGVLITSTVSWEATLFAGNNLPVVLTSAVYRSMNKQSQQSGGFALLLALIVSSVALSIGLSLLDITVKQLTLGATARESEVAFQVAATAMNCLQFARNTDLTRSQTNGSNFTIECVDLQFTFRDTNNSNSIVYYTNAAGNDFDVDGRNRCVQYDMYVLLATAGDVSTTNQHGDTITCDGDLGANVCTYAYARGHNRSCSDLSAGNSFIVQRELTAEF